MKLTAVLVQTCLMPWKNGVFIWSANKWAWKTNDLQGQMTERYCQKSRLSCSKHSLSRTARTDVWILVCLPRAATCSPPDTKCLLFTTNENEVCVLDFDGAFQCWASEAQCQKEFQGSRTFCVVRQEGDFSLYLHTQFMGLKPETNFSPLGLIFRSLALLLSAQLCFVVLVPAFLEIIRVKLHVQKEKG